MSVTIEISFNVGPYHYEVQRALTAYFGGVAKVTDSEGSLWVLFVGRPSSPWLPDAFGNERYIEVHVERLAATSVGQQPSGYIEITTRAQDEFVNDVAGALARQLALHYVGEIVAKGS